jgi:hypothetical protein
MCILYTFYEANTENMQNNAYSQIVYFIVQTIDYKLIVKNQSANS